MPVFEKDELLLRLSEFFKALSDHSRMKIVYCLLDKEKCVSDIVDEVGLTQTAVSYQLKLLRQLHLVKYRREGQRILYSIDDDHVINIVKTAKEHIEE